MFMFLTIIAIYWIGAGAVFGRVDGGGITRINEWVERALIMFGFVLACAPVAGVWSFAALLGTFGIATGHGQYFLNRMAKYVEPEFFDFVVRPLFGEDPRTWYHNTAEPPGVIQIQMDDYGMTKLYWRNVFGMFVTGTLVGLPSFVVCMAFGASIGWLFLLTGFAKSVAYVVGYEVFYNTETAEYINGGLRNAICLLVILYTLLYSGLEVTF